MIFHYHDKHTATDDALVFSTMSANRGYLIAVCFSEKDQGWFISRTGNGVSVETGPGSVFALNGVLYRKEK
jgi:hypothetical protein